MRNAEFDREQVLRSAIQAFLLKGYAKTSMQDLKKATGLHPGSIYCAFESKQGLLIAALEQYNLDKGAEFLKFFSDKSKVIFGIKAYLDNTVEQCSSECSQKLCLSQKALNELAEQDPLIEKTILNNMKSWQQGFIDLFETALLNGEINANRSPESRARSLVLGIYGLRTYAQMETSSTVLTQLAQQLFEDVTR
ncbi:TetR family transcriptional regulator [Shewanella sp. OPT22]|nr:TetR family transcriptional regulator [Shewanella sp. OPT22]